MGRGADALLIKIRRRRRRAKLAALLPLVSCSLHGDGRMAGGCGRPAGWLDDACTLYDSLD